MNYFFCFKQKTAYEMRISDWSSDVCSSDLCPDFSREGNHEFEGSMTSNFGCAVNSNLAAMVARPQDLVRGQPGAPSVDPATATKAIQTFRAAKPTGAGGLQSETTGGK